jgi:hypothetical protein
VTDLGSHAPADRYGRRPPQRGLVLAGAVLVAVLAGWAGWVTVTRETPSATGQVTGFRVPGRHVINATLRVSADPGRVRCTVKALGSGHEVVGVTTARVQVGSSGQAVTSVPIRTRDTAVTAFVDGCTAAGD